VKVVGIDPGLTGGIAVLYGEKVLVMDAPRLDAGRGALDAAVIVRILKTVKPDLVVIERQQAMPLLGKQPCPACKRMPSQGIASTFTTGYGFGLYNGILAALGLKHVIVSARVWQTLMYQGAVGQGKERSLYVSSQLFPGIVLKKSQHGRADALLIAEYGRRTLA
jgi:hypothetical protein